MANRQRVFLLVGTVICLLAIAITSHWVSIPLGAVAAAFGTAVLAALTSYLPHKNVRFIALVLLNSSGPLVIRDIFYSVSKSGHFFYFLATLQSGALVWLFFCLAAAAIVKPNPPLPEDRVA